MDINEKLAEKGSWRQATGFGVLVTWRHLGIPLFFPVHTV